MEDSIRDACGRYMADKDIPDKWNLTGLRDHFLGWLTIEDDLTYSARELEELETTDIEKLLIDRAREKYSEREQRFGAELMREIERVVLLRSVDHHWMDHIDAMDELRRGIYLRAYGQHNPVVEYRNEGYDMFNAMTESIREETAKLMMTVEIRRKEEVRREKVAKVTSESGGSDGSEKRSTTVNTGRNALCPCGSGKKYKRCCGKDK